MSDETKFAWRDGARFPVTAEVAGEELERIANLSDGELRPPAVVEESRPEEAPLHPCFEWDDEQAAELYRCDQARHIIRAVVIQSTETDEKPRYQYVSVTPAASGERAYVDTKVVMSDAAMRAQAIDEARSQLEGWRNRFAHLTELGDLFAAIDRVLAVPAKKAKPKRRQVAQAS